MKVIDYDDDDGLYHFFSKTGSEEEDVEFYQCEGTCYCGEGNNIIDESDDTRRSVASKIGVFLAMGLFGILGVKFNVSLGSVSSSSSLRRRVEEKCDEICEGECIESEVGDCISLENDNNEIERVLCRGNCIQNSFFVQEYNGIIDCNELTLSTVLEEDSLKSALSTTTTTSFHEFFATEFLSDFCLQEGRIEVVDDEENQRGNNNIFQCEGWKGQVEGEVFDGDWNLNPSIDCIIERQF